MAASSHSAPDAVLPPGRWTRALAGDAEAFRELAGSYWYAVYAWWRRAGCEDPGAATGACFTRWLTAAPPQVDQPGARSFREWLLAQLRELSAKGVEPIAEPAIEIAPGWAEGQYAQEPAGSADEIFQRRWALTVLEFAMEELRAEYAARGQEALFAEASTHAGFDGDDERYRNTAGRLGLSLGAARKAVFDFRSQHREMLRRFVADTVADPGEIDHELTALLAALPNAVDQAPLPSAIQSFKPDELFARALESVRMTSSGGVIWTPPSDAEMAQLFPQYEMHGMVGRGGMGAVYKARQVSLDRLVAIKLLPLEISVDADFADRFRREARAMARLYHPNIIPVFEFGQTSEGHLFFTMQFVEGAMLHTLIHGRKGQPTTSLPPAEALELVEQVCDALAYAHEQGIVHRDIKPANVMVDTHGRVKVADFGLARMAEADPAQWGSTTTGVVMGTPDYMAPEQKRGLHVDHRADIYALGVLLYEALCKETPQGAFVMPSKRCGLDKRLDGIISKALATDPEKRFQSTTEMKAAIEAVRPAVAKAQARKPPASKPAPKLARASSPRNGAAKSKLPLALAAALIVLAVAIGARYLPRDKSKAAPPPAAPLTAAATIEAPFTNTLGMKFVPVPISGGPTGGQRILFSIWETRVQDYEAFAQTTNRAWRKPGFAQGPTHPAVILSWDDAQAFCAWLTEREHAAGRLTGKERYRLPSDHEWSCAIGIGDYEDPAMAPEQKFLNNLDLLPWGTIWPPPANVGNYSGEEIGDRKVRPGQPFLSGYRDAFAETAPVGSFPANAFGLHDLSGNVWEWCDDLFKPTTTYRVLRGGAFDCADRKVLWSSHRDGLRNQSSTGASLGFRVVLDTGSGAAPGAIPASARADALFVNTLGMKFVPVPVAGGKRVLFSIWETRVQDYEPFAREARRVWPKPDFAQGPTHPAVNVNWEDAWAFCLWLTQRERQSGKLGVSEIYRLPTDHEWSCAVGLGDREDRAKTPEERGLGDAKIFPWGSWPPATLVGNFSGEETMGRGVRSSQERLAGYRDSFPETAPVGSFPANPLGLYDLSGNVWEWCSDFYNALSGTRVTRGGSFDTGTSSVLASTHRDGLRVPETRGVSLGFRVVLASDSPADAR